MAGTDVMHTPECEFEFSLNHTDAQLLQRLSKKHDRVAQPHELPEETDGMVATLALNASLCNLMEQSSVSPAQAERLLASEGALGELSFFKGFEHLNDWIPKA